MPRFIANTTLRILFIVNILLSSASSASDLKEESEPRKTLILHVGPPKTATTSIQTTLWKNSDFLKMKGIYYPKTIGNEDCYMEQHWIIAERVQSGHMDKVYSMLDIIHRDAKDCHTIILSSELFGLMNVQASSLEFLNKLLNKYDLKIVYCVRSFADLLASELAFGVHSNASCILSSNSFEAYSSSYFYDRYVDQIIFFSYFKTIFISFDSLDTEQRLCNNFLKCILGKDYDLREERRNYLGHYGGPHILISKKKLRKLESFLNFHPRELESLYNPHNSSNKDFYERIKSQTKRLALDFMKSHTGFSDSSLGIYPRNETIGVIKEYYLSESGYSGWTLELLAQVHNETTLPQSQKFLLRLFDPNVYLALHPDVNAAYQNCDAVKKALEARRHYIYHGYSECRIFVSLPSGFDCHLYISLHKDLKKCAKEMSIPAQFRFAQLHYVQWGKDEGRIYEPN